MLKYIKYVLDKIISKTYCSEKEFRYVLEVYFRHFETSTLNVDKIKMDLI